MNKGPSGQNGLQAYIDANLLFTISYPERWAPFLAATGSGPYSPYSVGWEVREDGLNNDVSLRVISIPKHEIIPGIDPTRILLDLYPNLTLVSQEEVPLPAGPANKLHGYTPHKTLQSWVITGDQRLYLLIFTSPPEYFASQAELFQQIVLSFEFVNRTP
jgi:hypothetical protein